MATAATPKVTAVELVALHEVHYGSGDARKVAVPGARFFVPAQDEADWLIENGAAKVPEAVAK